ncbi:MAG: polyketide synthase dehydratase domain-containing protein [Pirellulaceae bacterium]|nr:polyketide synthase dehydratase domain-containing protein [Pirellulaceae bacterium]
MSNELKNPSQDVGQHSSTTGKPVAATRGPHPLLGNRADVADKGIIYETAVNARRPSYLEDHRIYGSVVVPAAAYAEMAVAAGTDACPRQDVILQGMAIQQAMFLESGVTRVVQTILTREEKDLLRFRICSRADRDREDESTWLEHASGKLIAQEEDWAPDQVDLQPLQETLTERVEAAELYEACHLRGLEYGPQFQAVRTIRTGGGRSLGEVRIADRLSEQAADYLLHPALLDACLQTLAAALRLDDISSALLPVGIDQMRVYIAGESSVWSRGQITSNAKSGKSITADIDILTADGRLVASVEGLRIRRVKKEIFTRSRRRDADRSLSRMG